MNLKALHIEWSIFLIGLMLMALMSPATNEPSLCLFERLGFTFCLGDGLGHSIAYIFRGDFISALEANIMGPFAVIVLMLRIIYIWKTIYINYKNEEVGTQNV